MSFWLEPELRRYFDRFNSPMATGNSDPTAQQKPQGQQQDAQNAAAVRAEVSNALAADPMLAFMIRLDNVLHLRGNVVTCLVTIRRNVHQHELLYLQRFKQIAEPEVRYPRIKEQAMLYLDPKTLRCGQQVLLKIETRLQPTEPMQLLRECTVLRASGGRDLPMFPRAYLFGSLGDEAWRVASTDSRDLRQLLVHKRHFLLCQNAEDSVQRILDCNWSSAGRLISGSAVRLGRDMLIRLRHLHGLGWVHNDLRPDCFRLTVGGEAELLLCDFVAASPIRRDDEGDDAHRLSSSSSGGGVGQRTTYRSVQFQQKSDVPACGVFADLESLVYIVCALMSPTPLPWEVTKESASLTVDVASKLAVWQFVEEVEGSSSRHELWQTWRLDRVFNCTSEQVGDHPAFRLALAVSQLYNAWSDASLRSKAVLPDYVSLFYSLRDPAD